jgi:hypothetical protein
MTGDAAIARDLARPFSARMKLMLVALRVHGGRLDTNGAVSAMRVYRRTVLLTGRALADRRLIEIERRPGRRTVYRLVDAA